MAQLLIRGIDDRLMAAFRRKAARLGWSMERLAREVIEREARDEQAWLRFEKHSAAIHERLRRQGGVYEDSAQLIRNDRDRDG